MIVLVLFKFSGQRKLTGSQSFDIKKRGSSSKSASKGFVVGDKLIGEIFLITSRLACSAWICAAALNTGAANAGDLNDWSFTGHSGIIHEYRDPLGFWEGLIGWVNPQPWPDNLYLGCQNLPKDTPGGQYDLKAGRYGTLSFVVSNDVVPELFSGVTWTERGDSSKEYPTTLKISGVEELNVAAVALINDNMDEKTIHVYADYLPQRPLKYLLAGDQFSVTIVGPYRSATWNFNPNGPATEIESFFNECECFGEACGLN